MQQFQGDETIQIWVGSGTGAHLHCSAAHDISSKLTPQVPKALHFSMHSRGATPYPVLRERQEHSNGHVELFSCGNHCLLSVGNTTPMVNDTYMTTLGCFMVLLHDRTSAQTAVNDADKQLFEKREDNLMAFHLPEQPH